jgi:hypothetical protein
MLRPPPKKKNNCAYGFVGEKQGLQECNEQAKAILTPIPSLLDQRTTVALTDALDEPRSSGMDYHQYCASSIAT